jgi:hypothetical protein
MPFGIILLTALAIGAQDPGLSVSLEGPQRVIRYAGVELKTTRRDVRDLRLIDVEGSAAKVVLWNEAAGRAPAVPHYAILPDGKTVAQVTDTSYDLMLRYRRFDPLAASVQVPEEFQVPESHLNIWIVQFHSQPLQEYRDQIEAVGGKIHYFLGHHSYLVRLDDEAREAVRKMSFVRWVGAYEPAYRLDERVMEPLMAGTLETRRYNIQVYEAGLAQKETVAFMVRALGGTVNELGRPGYILEATLTPHQLLQIVRMNEVFFIDPWSPMELDMDIARQIGGGTYVESIGNYRGQGVRVSVRDGGVRTTHVDFAGRLTIRGNTTSTSHGTPVTGVVIGSGAGQASGRGMMPDAHAIFINGLDSTGSTRYTQTAALLGAPHFAVLETVSGGSALTGQYTTDSFTMDDILLNMDILLLNSMSNWGNNTQVRPQAWAKNMVSVGGVKHQNTLTKADDNWTGGASIGPAADGRIKPELTHFYDSVWCPASGSDTAYGNFSGTSSATPIVAGHFGILFQMWRNGIFGHTVVGNTVFESRPKNALMRALMYNNASPYPFVGAGADLSRVKQGYGLPDLRNVYDRRHATFMVNEEHVLQNLQARTYRLFVPAGQPDLRVTMVYKDPPGTTSSTLHRINDLSLKVTAPSGTVYHGNNGLLDGLWSTPGGSPNAIDTTENVFVQNPQSGVWTVEVRAAQINQDSHLETTQIDSAFALVATGVVPNTRAETLLVRGGRLISGGLPELETSDDGYVRVGPALGSRYGAAALFIESTAPTTTLSELAFRLESSSSHTGIRATVSLYDYVAGTFVQVGQENQSLTDTVTTAVPSNPSRFVNPSNRKMAALVVFQQFEGTPGLDWQGRVDQARWFLAP